MTDSVDRTQPLDEPGRRKRRKRRLGRAALAMTAVVAALGIGECAVRLLDIGPQISEVNAGSYRLSENSVLRYEYLPGAKDGPVKINSAGMRDRPRSPSKPVHTFRIACIGDSIAAGFHGPAAETVASQLENLLNRYWAAPERRFEVLNFGVTGYNITQVVESLAVKAVEYEPDLILYLYCLNDAQDYSYELAMLQIRLTDAERSYHERLAGKPGKILRKSRLWVLARYTWEAQTFEGSQRPAMEEDPRRPYRDNQERYFDLLYSREQNRRRVIDGLDRLASLRSELDVPAYVAVFPLFVDIEDYGFGTIHDRVSSAVRDRSLKAIDLLEPFQAWAAVSDEPVSIDVFHPSPEGHALAAVVILRRLLADGVLPASEPRFDLLATDDAPVSDMARVLLDQDTAVTDRPGG